MKKILRAAVAAIVVLCSASATALAAGHPNGSLVKDAATGNLYLIVNGQKRYIFGQSVLASNGYDWRRFVTATADDLSLPGDSSYTNWLPYREGSIIKITGYPYIWALDEISGSLEKHLIQSPTIFAQLGYTSADVEEYDGNSEEGSYVANNVQNAADISSPSVHPNGTVVRDPTTGAFYLIDNGQQRYFGGLLEFESYNVSQSDATGLTLARVKTATVGDLALPYGPKVGFRSGTLIRGSGPEIYVIDNDGAGTITKRHVLSPASLAELGWPANPLMQVDDSLIPPTSGADY